MADIGVNAPPPSSGIQALRDRQAYFNWQARLAAIEVQREEARIAAARLDEEEANIKRSLADYEAKYTTTRMS